MDSIIHFESWSGKFHIKYVSFKKILYIRGVHGYIDEGGKLKNKQKGVFEEALVK